MAADGLGVFGGGGRAQWRIMVSEGKAAELPNKIRGRKSKATIYQKVRFVKA
jgi:hypothetical protein